MKEFIIRRNGKKEKLLIHNAKLRLIDCVSVDAEFKGLKVKDKLLSYGGGYKKPIIRFIDENDNFIDVELNSEIIEYLWEKVGNPTTGLFYGYTKNYRDNWTD